MQHEGGRSGARWLSGEVLFSLSAMWGVSINEVYSLTFDFLYTTVCICSCHSPTHEAVRNLPEATKLGVQLAFLNESFILTDVFR